MKKPGIDLSSIAALVGTAASAVGLVGALSATVGLSGAFVTSLIGPLAGAALGFGAKYVVDSIRRLQRDRRVFISYASPDQAVARKLSDQLREAGSTKVWFAPDQLKPGRNVRESIETAIRDSDVVIAFLSSPETEWLHEEVRLAKAYGVRILPVLTRRDAAVPPELTDISRIVLEGDASLKEVVQAATE